MIPGFHAELDCSLKQSTTQSEQQMKTKQTITKTTPRTLWTSLLVILLGTLLAAQAHGHIFVSSYSNGNGTVAKYKLDGTILNASLITGLTQPTGLALSGNNLYVLDFGNGTNGTVGEYDATTGAAINAALITGLPTNSIVLAVSGDNLYVAESNGGNGAVALYNATTGAVINPSLVTGLFYPQGIAISGNNLYVPSQENLAFGYIDEYNATTGTPVRVPLISGLLNAPEGLLVSGNILYQTNTTAGTVGEYDATTGAVINASFISGFTNPSQLALLGNNLFVVDYTVGTVGEYDATTGATINASLISGLSGYSGIAVQQPPRCPQPRGYWKTNPALWPVTSLVLGSQTYSETELLKILMTRVDSRPKTDASLILADQLIAAKLNIANGSDPAPVRSTITDADSLLSAFSGKLPYKVKPSSAIGQMMVNDANTLNSYNNDLLTPVCSP
jgi:hypothetical protein